MLRFKRTFSFRDPRSLKKYFFLFYFPDRESIVIVKKIDVEILMNLPVLRSQESEKVVFEKRRVYSVLYDGCWRRKYKRE